MDVDPTNHGGTSILTQVVLGFNFDSFSRRNYTHKGNQRHNIGHYGVAYK